MSDMPYEVIEITDRLRLIQLQASDADRLFWLIDTNRDYLAQYLPWVNKTVSVDDSQAFITMMIERRHSGEEYGYGIEYDGRVVGHGSLMHLKQKQTPEIGYWIASDYQGRGIASAFAETLTELALTTLKFSDVIIRAEPSNLGSNRVAEKCGYKRDGEIEENGTVLNIWRKLAE